MHGVCYAFPFAMADPHDTAPLAVVWAYRRTGKFAFHVLAGALANDARTAHVPIEFANGVDAVVAVVALER